MAVRTGSDYLKRLREHSSQVWLRGKRVDDVTTHPSLERIASTIASLYDLQHDPAHRDVLTYVEEESGAACATAFMMPKSYGIFSSAARPFGSTRSEHWAWWDGPPTFSIRC